MYAEGSFVDDVFYVAEVKQGFTTIEGKPYLTIALANQEINHIDGRFWDKKIEDLGVEQGEYARVQGTVKVFNGNTQITISSVHKVAPVEMVRESCVALPDLMARLDAVVNQVPEETISRELWERFIANDELYNAYLTAPAAMTMHHNYKYGLLEHSVSVAEAIIPKLPDDEFGLGVISALLHDVGKINTYAFAGPSVVMTDEGKLLGHIVLGVIHLQPLLVDFPDIFNCLFLNAVVGHHGKYEWGSPELPKTRFAWLLHHADMMDSVSQHIVDMPEWDGWMSGDKMLRTDLFRL